MAPRSGTGEFEDAKLDQVTLAAAGDPAAREQVVREHQPMIQALAQKRAGKGLSPEDLEQEGAIGLISAVDHFPVVGRTDFPAYAREQIAQYMDQALALEEEARQEERASVEDAEAFDVAEGRLRLELKREPTPAELARQLGWEQARLDGVAALVSEARRRHDEEILGYLDDQDLAALASIGDDGDDGTDAGGPDGRGSA